MIQSKAYKEIIDLLGENHQILVAVEECSEFIAAAAQFANRGRDVKEELIEEIADVHIVMEQMKLIFGEEVIKEAIKKKLKKLEGHIDGIKRSN